jgi:hypothetical protein
MSSLSHPPAHVVPDRRHWSAQLLERELWASLAIAFMWVAVAVAAVWAPDFVSSDGTTIPSGIAVALFAAIGTRAIAQHGFGHHGRDD